MACPDLSTDIAAFQLRVDAAMRAFARDASYAASMARAAVVITTKRRAGLARRTLREAELTAQGECRAAGQFECHATSPCGVGDCKFATGELAALSFTPTGGTARRPQAVSTGSYSMRPAVTALARLPQLPQR